MRLDAYEVRAIKMSAARAFGSAAIVRVFGSRVDDARKGGDIDLHIEVPPGIDTLEAQCRFESGLFARIDEQKVDVVIRKLDEPLRGIDMIAHRDGILL